MRSFLIQIILALSIVTVGRSQIVGFEYFLGTDPGIGKAGSLDIANGNSVSGNYNLTLGHLPVGFHWLGIRAKDAQGRFSQTFMHPFYLLAPNADDITQVEYFIDVDPGYGNGSDIPVELDEEGYIKYLVPLSEIGEGSHLLGLRTKNSTGYWSQTKLWFFYNRRGSIPTKIVRLNYFFTGEGAPNKTYTYTLPEPGSTLDINAIADLNDLESGKQYTIHLTAIDENGQVSNPVTSTFFTIPPIIIQNTEIIHLTCFGSDNGSVSITASGGQGTLEYSLDGENFTSDSTFENLASGDYTIFVRGTENKDYIVESSITIDSPEPLVLDLTDVISPSCPGDPTGELTAIATGGTAPYRYKLQSQTEFQTINSFSGLLPGNYTLTVVDANGCEISIDQQLAASGEAPPVPTISVQGIDGISTEVSLWSSSTNGNQWLRNGEEISGATGQSLEITQPGTYQVRVTGSSGCTSISATTVITSQPEVSLLDIKLYPNPAEDRVKIGFGRDIYIDRVTIISSSGVVLRTVLKPMTLPSDEILLDLKGLKGGTYFIQVEGIGIMERIKLIKR